MTAWSIWSTPWLQNLAVYILNYRVTFASRPWIIIIIIIIIYLFTETVHLSHFLHPAVGDHYRRHKSIKGEATSRTQQYHETTFHADRCDRYRDICPRTKKSTYLRFNIWWNARQRCVCQIIIVCFISQTIHVHVRVLLYWVTCS